MKKLIFLNLLLLPFLLWAQLEVKVIGDNGKPVENALVTYNGQESSTNSSGFARLVTASRKDTLKITKDGFLPFVKVVIPRASRQVFDVLLRERVKENEIEAVVFQGKARGRDRDLTSVQISAKEASEVVSATGGIEDLLKTLPYVNSNTELSSQYMVRGGNYDENLIYINGIEIYRPFLIRNSLQEGMSIINPDMVADVDFSAGGFEARYGDKMSSVLNVFYRRPTKFELDGEASLIDGRLTVGTASKNQKFTALVSARYRNTDLLLNTLKGDTDFNPVYKDLQAYLTYHINPKWTLSFIGYLSQNDYLMIPKSKQVNFGTLLHPLTLTVGYAGREDDRYKNAMGTATIDFHPNKKWNFTIDAFGYDNREKEYYTIASAYQLQPFDPDSGDPIVSYDVGGGIDQARNDLVAQVVGAQFRTKYSPDVNTDFEVGFKYEREKLQDFTNQWQLVDSLGYNTPRPFLPVGQLDRSALKLRYQIAGQNLLNSNRVSGYGQFSKKFYWGENRMFVNAGVRFQHWDFNGQTLVSPRAQLAIKPDWNADMLFKLSGGVYYQAPFYKQIKDLTGQFDPNIKAEKSYQAILANDYEFQMVDRPFKLTTEVYYKAMSDLIPYYVDNVRTLYTGKNDATGYAYGLDARLFGEFVPGVDSWISASYARAMWNINHQGFIPMPTDQRFRFSMFYQDYMPEMPSMRVNITAVYAFGLPNGTPIFQNLYLYQNRLPSYKRVDIGLSKVFIDQKNNKPQSGTFWSNFTELTLGVQIFNAFNIHNTVANQWINDVTTGLNYAVPVYMTGRFFNVRLVFKM